MELTRTPEGNVTPLATIRAIRGVTLQTLAARVGAEPEQVLGWERGEPFTLPMAKRLGLALGWKWEDLQGCPLAHEDAWTKLVEARQKLANCR